MIERLERKAAMLPRGVRRSEACHGPWSVFLLARSGGKRVKWQRIISAIERTAGLTVELGHWAKRQPIISSKTE